MFFIFSIAIATILVSCSTEELEQYNPDFKGKWKSNVYYTSTVGDSVQNFLVIDGRDSGFGIACEKSCEFCNCLTFQVGRARIKESTKELQIGGSVNQILQINEEPFINNENTWQLKINNIEYFKYED